MNDKRDNEGPQSAALQALRGVITASGRFQAAVARRAGLSQSELRALEHLLSRASDQPLGPADLSRLLDVSTAASTQIADRLEGRGHLERRPDPGDRRRTQLAVTDSGRAEVIAHLVPMFVELEQWDDGFSEEERAVVERYLTGVHAALDRLAEQP